jgi:hypothetical protein
MDNRPKSIIVTFPVQFLIELGISWFDTYFENKPYQGRKKKEYVIEGFKECIRQIEAVNADPDDFWNHTMGNKPVDYKNISHCYINILSKIRYRAKVICFECAEKGEVITKIFGNRQISSKNWILLHQFEKIEPAIKMGGFQGFRYWKEDY